MKLTQQESIKSNADDYDEFVAAFMSQVDPKILTSAPKQEVKKAIVE